MAHQPHNQKSLQTPSPPSPSLKIKTLVPSYIFHNVGHVVRAFANAKTKFMELLNKTIKLRRRWRKKNKVFSSVTLHRNWSSSHIIPIPESSMFYDSTWSSMIATEGDEGVEPPLSGYLHWLEKKEMEKEMEDTVAEDDESEIDRLAEKFIAKCHEKFMLEKVESYRMFQEMLARSV